MEKDLRWMKKQVFSFCKIIGSETVSKGNFHKKQIKFELQKLDKDSLS